MDRRRFLATGGTAAALLGGFPARLLAADPAVTGSWVAVLGRPVMMHVPARAAASSTIGWLLRLCG